MTTQHRLLEDYQDLNSADHDIFVGAPTPLEFMRMIHVSRPVLFENCPLPLQNAWTDEYLAANVGEVSVAITPDGRADALVDGDDGIVYFVEPHVEKMSMKGLLDRLSLRNSHGEGEVAYLQSQNDNLRQDDSEFVGIRNDIPLDIPWATEALDRSPDAANIWVGNNRSVTSVHSDPYENIYAVIRGTKIFTLFPPIEGPFLQEKDYPHARWTKNDDSQLVIEPTHGKTVRWSSIRDATQPIPPTRPVTVVVRERQMLYLPVGWWHYVEQIPDQYGKVVACNYWYDQEPQGHSLVFINFVRSLGTPSENKDDA